MLLKDGMAWREGFISGLLRSRCFIALVSKKVLTPCTDRYRDHFHVNVLLEFLSIEQVLDIENIQDREIQVYDCSAATDFESMAEGFEWLWECLHLPQDGEGQEDRQDEEEE